MEKFDHPILNPKALGALLAIAATIAPVALPQNANAQQGNTDEFSYEFQPGEVTPDSVAEWFAISNQELTAEVLRKRFPDITQKEIEDAIARFEYIKVYFRAEKDLTDYYLQFESQWPNDESVKQWFARQGITLKDKEASDLRSKIFHAKIEAGHRPSYIPPPPLGDKAPEGDE